jgi:hypothetical protein
VVELVCRSGVGGVWPWPAYCPLPIVHILAMVLASGLLAAALVGVVGLGRVQVPIVVARGSACTALTSGRRWRIPIARPRPPHNKHVNHYNYSVDREADDLIPVEGANTLNWPTARGGLVETTVMRPADRGRATRIVRYSPLKARSKGDVGTDAWTQTATGGAIQPHLHSSTH